MNPINFFQKAFLTLLLLGACLSICCQVNIILVDVSNSEPIDAAHVFIANSSYGALSDDSGQVQLQFNNKIQEDLIISHINYKTLRTSTEIYRNWSLKDTIFLRPKSNELSGIVITDQSKTKRRKYLKLFEKALLGHDSVAKKCKIVNPDEIVFETYDGGLRAYSNELLTIENSYLAYKIDLYLSELIMQNDGSSSYKGQAQFSDLGRPSAKILKRREKAYFDSPRFFFRSLLDHSLAEDAFRIRSAKYNAGVFETIQDPLDESIAVKDSILDQYKVSFDEFLEVKNLNLKDIKVATKGSVSGGAESRRFNRNYSSEITKTDFATSQLYTLGDGINIDVYGHVLNQAEVKEYGFWAERRLAYTLPWDYRIDEIEQKETMSINFLTEENDFQDIQVFRDLISLKQDDREASLLYLTDSWKQEYIPPLLDVLYVKRDQWTQDEIKVLLKKKLPQIHEHSYFDVIQYLWSNPAIYPSYYAAFKAELYGEIDHRFKNYFDDYTDRSLIRLDEIVWGGVKQDGIPPLRYPAIVRSDEQDYLADTDIIFGVLIDGIARAYPKRILAWHEMVVDTIAGKDIATIYCTLCGTVIPYNQDYHSEKHSLGTSGFLYRSNKLMYDKETSSLWNTITGEPVVGPLAGSGIQLEVFSAHTTTWGEWKSLYPESFVLDLDTGYARNYDEGEAYKEYFSTDRLMFPVPEKSKKLKNKDVVLVPRMKGYSADPVAFSVDFLKVNPLISWAQNDQNYLIYTNDQGLSRVYALGKTQISKLSEDFFTDSKGNNWYPSAGCFPNEHGDSLREIPTHQAFWFAWLNQYPSTRLIK